MSQSESESRAESATNFLNSRMGRRGFLGTVLGGAAALIMQAYGRNTPVGAQSTSGSQGYLPFMSKNGDQPAFILTPTPLPTSTPESYPIGEELGASRPEANPIAEELEPTATPQPTPTPRPQPTPFPPGAKTKLGLFVGYHHAKLIDMLQTGNVAFIKTLEYDANLMEFIKQTSPNTIIVARYTPLAQIEWHSADPMHEARRFVDLILPIATEPKRHANIDAWESYNEPIAQSPEAMQRLAAFEAERTRLLAQAGIRSCIGNFGTGLPALELWPHFLPAVQALKEHNGYLGLHEYSAPYMWFGSGPYQLEEGVNEGDEGWLTLRYRKVYRQFLQPAGLEVPLLITETGIDGQVQNRPGPRGLGWQDFQKFWEDEGHMRTTAPGFYIEQLAWYDSQLQQDHYVKGAAIYALGASKGWGSFELAGHSAEILHQYFTVH